MFAHIASAFDHSESVTTTFTETVPRDAAGYRWEPRSLRLSAALVAAIVVGTPGGIAAFALPEPWRELAIVVTIAVGAWAVHRAFRLSLEADAETVRVVNYWRTYAFTWIDVAVLGIGLILAGGVVLQPGVVFVLRDGRRVRARAALARPGDETPVLAALAALAPPSVEVLPER